MAIDDSVVDALIAALSRLEDQEPEQCAQPVHALAEPRLARQVSVRIAGPDIVLSVGGRGMALDARHAVAVARELLIAARQLS